jgi:Antibiotic biosynthesis monooxygenase
VPTYFFTSALIDASTGNFESNMNLMWRSSLVASIALRGSTSSAFVHIPKFRISQAVTSSSFSSSSLASKPFGVIVQAEIQPDRMEEFLRLIEENATKSRAEPGCLRFGM